MSKRAPGKRRSPMSDAQIVAAYREHDLPRMLDELDWFAEPQTERLRISRAADACLRSGKRCPHQYRLSKTVLEEAKARLLENKRLPKITDFDELLKEVEATIRPIYGVGPLYVYDTALRYGAGKGIEPSSIYLHAGARQGAARLLDSVREPTIERSRLPPPYRELTARQIENLLCCYHGNFIPISKRTGPSVSAG